MDCQQLRDRIETLSLIPPGSLPPDVVVHLHNCSECQRLLHEHQAAWLSLSDASPPEMHADESLETRIIERIRNAPTPVREYPANLVFAKYAVAVAVLFLLASLTLWQLGLVGDGAPTDHHFRRIQSFAQRVEKLDELQRVFAAPELKYVSLQTQPTDLVCYLVQDPMSQQIHFLGSNLNAAAEGHQLTIWLMSDSGELIASAPINLQLNGIGTALLSTGSEARTALITEEPEQHATLTPSDRVILRCSVDLR